MKNKISKILGIGLSAGLVFGLIGAVFAAPVSADLMKWGIVNTPSWEDNVILPAGDILDYDIGGDGDVIYAILELGCYRDPTYDDGCFNPFPYYGLFKSEDGGVSWTDITKAAYQASGLPECTSQGFDTFWFVSVAPDDEDWVAVVGWSEPNNDIWVVASKDGGDNFTFAGEVKQGTTDWLEWVFDIEVSIEVDGIHNIAVAGRDNESEGAIFRLEAGTWLSGSWVETGDDYSGWSAVEAVVDCEFSPNFDIDDTIVCLGVDGWRIAGGQPFLQSGIWEGGSGTWNTDAGFPSATEITANGDTLNTNAYNRSMGLALPADYDGSDPGARVIYLYINAVNMTTWVVGGWLVRVDNGSVSEPMGPPGEPLLASIDFHGDADTGKMMIGEFYQWDDSVALGSQEPIDAFGDNCCAGVRVWHTVELDPCCPDWEVACKDPSGPYLALVRYTPDGAKAYATTSGTVDMDQDGGGTGEPEPNGDDLLEDLGFLSTYATGTPGDESAFSVSLDDGVSFNQIGLIDTDIDYLSDVAVCPDCSTIYLSTINMADGMCFDTFGICACDSVWRSYDDGDTWERIFHGDWADSQSDALLLRLPCDAVEDCCDQDPVSPSGTIYLGLYGTKDIFYSRDCGQCWNDPPATKIDIQDFCVESENIVYIIDNDGMFSKSTQYGRRWSDAIDTDIGHGHSIACCCEQGFVVVGGYGDEKVAWSDDGGDSFNLTTDALPGTSSQRVHVACDPVCENIIYAALCSAPGMGGIYRVDISSSAWDDLNAEKFPYYGIVVSREGTLYAVSYAIQADKDADDPCNTTFGTGLYYSGVARNLDPCETACCGTEDWDYLTCGLTGNASWDSTDKENFDLEPSALKICGCLSIDTNSILWAIDSDYYDVAEGLDGALWSYEDCAAKIGPTLTAPADGTVLDCEPCAGCDAANFTLKWERMCEACSYDIQIMDDDGNLIVEWVDITITGDPPSLFVDGTMDGANGDYYLECGMNYTWKVREANTTCECVHSPWSETWSFTVAVGAADAINLLAPTKGAMDVPIENIGFSWTSVRNATTYSFVLSPNANLAGALVSQDQSTTAFNFVGPLDYSKAYYWQIIAWMDGTRLTTSSIGVFNTMAQPVAPTPPVVVEETPAPVINIPPAQEITPIWIYAMIGVGAALAVVVIVLIARSRRP